MEPWERDPQPIQCLLTQHEDLDLVPQHPCSYLGAAPGDNGPRTREAEVRGPLEISAYLSLSDFYQITEPQFR